MSSVDTSLDNWTVLMDRAKALYEADDDPAAELLLLEAYEVGVKLFGRSHGSVGLVLLRLAAICHRTGRSELAMNYEEEADDILRCYLLEH